VGRIPGQHFAARISGVVADVEAPGGESGKSKRGESNGKLPLRTCPECSITESYRWPDWALFPAQTGPRAEYYY